MQMQILGNPNLSQNSVTETQTGFFFFFEQAKAPKGATYFIQLKEIEQSVLHRSAKDGKKRCINYEGELKKGS